MITAVLNLHIGAAAGAKAVDQMAGGFGDGHNVIDLHLFGLAHEIRGHVLPGLRLHFFGIADHAIHLAHLSKGFGFGLGRAACDDQGRLRVFPTEFANFLTRLAHGFGGDGACVDDDSIVQASLLAEFLHRFGFIGIKPATERRELGRLAHLDTLRNASVKTP